MSNNPDIREVEEEAAGSIELASVHIVEPIASIDPTDDDAQMAKADLGPEEIASNGIGIAEKKGCCGKFLEWLESLLGDKDKVQWVENMRGSLSMAVSIIAAITFQVATNPPGGVVQAGPNDKFNPSNTCNDSNTDPFCPGHAVLAIVYPEDYLLFLKFNTTSFIASLSVCLMLVSGLPLKHRFVVWFLCMLMCVAITALAFTYIYAAALVTPSNIWYTAASVLNKVLNIWSWLLCIVAFLLILRLLVWVVNKLVNCNYKNLTKRLCACLFCKSECCLR